MPTISSGQISLVDMNDSKQLQMYISANQPKTQIYNPNDGSYTPNWTSAKPVLTPQLFIAGTSTDIIADATSIRWFVDNVEITESNTNYTIPTTGLKTLTINTNVLSAKNTTLIVCEVVYIDPSTGFDVIAKADIEFVKVSSGAKGDTGSASITAVLSNEHQTVPTLADGSGGVLTGVNTSMVIYLGTADNSASWTVTAGTPVGLTGTLTGKTYQVATMTADVGYVDLTATRSGYANIVKRFTVSKNKQGIQGGTGGTGASATSYWLVTSNSVIAKSISGVYNPTSLTVSSKSQTGSASPVAYAGRFIINESTDGTTFPATPTYTSTANEATKTHNVGANVKAIKVQFFLAGGTATLLDEQTIPVVSDGATGQAGANAVRAVVWTPNGNTIKNSSGSLSAQCDVYNGSTILTSGVTYKWYELDPTATTSSGGDADGGAGWRLITSTYTAGGVTNYTTNKITIPASAIQNLESFKCVATYNSVKYNDVATVMDMTDPFQIIIQGNAIFKNGVGSTSLTAKVFQNAVEIDTAGTGGYTYTWSLYDANNAKVTSFNKTGKTITVLASEINSRANIVCELSK